MQTGLNMYIAQHLPCKLAEASKNYKIRAINVCKQGNIEANA